MKKYFSAKNWVSADAYYSYGDSNELVNVLVPINRNLDLRIGETIIPTYELLKDLVKSCIKWIKEFHGTFEDNGIPYETIFDVYEEVKNNEFFVSWILSKKIIPSKSNEKQYEIYKKAYFDNTLSYSEIDENIKRFIEELGIEADVRIEVSDVIHDFQTDSKIYVLDIKHRLDR